MAQSNLSGAVPIHPRSVLRTEVFDQEMIALASNYKVPARKGLIVDLDVSGVITPDRQRVIAKLPAFDRQAIVAK